MIEQELEPNKSEDVKFLPENSNAIETVEKKEPKCIDLLNKTACVLFGMGWLPLHFVFSQIPHIIQTAPEKWSLPSQVVIVISLGNIIVLIHYFNKRRLLSYDTTLIFATFIINIASLIAIAFTFDIVVPINGQPHSLFLFIFIFFLASGGCMSVLLFLPFMSRLKKEYLVPYFIGQGVDASVPGLLGLLQGVTSDGNCPNSSEMVFSSRYFFLLGAFFVILSAISFFHLNKQVESRVRSKDESKSSNETKTNCQRSYYVLLLVLQAISSFFQYGIMTGLQSYSCLPYRYGKLVYQVTVNANQFLGGIIVYLISLTELKSTRRLLVISALQMCIISYEITTAFMSPTPPMVLSLFGSVHIAFVWIIGNVTLFYTKLSIAAILREKSPKHLYYYGAATQVGAAAGALCSFVVINFTNLLHSIEMEPCKS